MVNSPPVNFREQFEAMLTGSAPILAGLASGDTIAQRLAVRALHRDLGRE